jgi:glutathione S-transferase
MVMKLFYAAGASSLAPHILLEEIGQVYQLERVNLDTKTWAGGDYNQVNPNSYVPALETDDGHLITECAVILEYLGLRNPTNNLIALYDSDDYWQQRMYLNYIATELHKNFISPFRRGNWLPDTKHSKELIYSRVFPRLQYLNQILLTEDYLVNNQFSAPDAYLFVMTGWLQRLALSFKDLAGLAKFDQRMRQRPAVQRVLAQEGQPHSLQE